VSTFVSRTILTLRHYICAYVKRRNNLIIEYVKRTLADNFLRRYYNNAPRTGKDLSVQKIKRRDNFLRFGFRTNNTIFRGGGLYLKNLTRISFLTRRCAPSKVDRRYYRANRSHPVHIFRG